MDSDINKLKDHFLSWEKENNCFNFRINGLSAYRFIRLDLFELLIYKEEKIANLEAIDFSFSQMKSFKAGYKMLFNSIKYFFSFPKKRNKHVVISSSVNTVFNSLKNHYSDKYFHFIKGNNEMGFLEFPFPPKLHQSKHEFSSHRIYGDIFYLGEYLTKVTRVQAVEIDSFLDKVISSFLAEFQFLSFDEKEYIFLKKTFYNRISRNIKRKKIYQLLITLLKPKSVLVKSAYDPINIVFQQICAEKKIPFAELQHSHIYPFHMGYVLPKRNDNTFPDKLLCFDQFYKESLVKNAVWSPEKISVIGNPLKEFIQDKNISEISEKKQGWNIIIVMQHTIPKSFKDFLIEARTYPNYNFVVKLHPKFKEIQVRQLDKVCKLNNNIKLVSDGNIQTLFTDCIAVAGVYSTALIEAKELGCRVFLLPHILSDYYQDFVEKNIFNKVADLDQLIFMIESDVVQKNFSTKPANKLLIDQIWS
jgi:hypothetical protein